MTEKEEVCGTCKWHYKEQFDWVCVNSDSEYCTDWTGYLDTCDEWEERKCQN